jgi:hypothetical protein
MSLDLKKNNTVVKLAMDLESYDPILGPEWIPVYVETLVAVLKQHSRKINKIGKLMMECQMIDFEADTHSKLNTLLGEEESDDETDD